MEGPMEPSKSFFGKATKKQEKGELVAVPLTIFKDVTTVTIPKATAVSSSYLSSILPDPCPTSADVTIDFPSHKLQRGFSTTLQYLSDAKESLELDGFNVFEVLACAALLEAKGLQRMCELCVLRILSVHNFSAAVRYAVQSDRAPMIRACYHWMKRVGVEEWKERVAGSRGEKRDENRKMRIDVGAISAVGDIVGGGDGVDEMTVYTKKLKLDVSQMQFVCQATGRCGKEIFGAIVEDERRRRARHFEAGCISYPVDISTLGPPFAIRRKNKNGDTEETTNANFKKDEDVPASHAPPSKKSKDGYPGTRKCYLERRRGMGPEGTETHYIVYAEDSLDMLVAATSTPTVGQYYFSESEDDFLRHGDHYIGQMKSTLAGTQFHLYDDGISKSEGGSILAELERKQKALLVYQTNVLGRVPNAMNIVIPRPGLDNEFRDDATGDKNQIDSSGMYKAYSNNERDKFVMMETKKPKWNPKMEAWTMDFKGRAKLASKKNFILVDPTVDERVLMMFGKVTKNRWSLDYSPPMNPLTCLFVALTAFSSKLAVT
ncbi:hypothetical protein TL16_g09184 [Triparma laevis f. inornata]|uniref:Tubby C-terminal domain-containing protein n=1 Tax=Triparma laevis f. inornata TaxID=1714386 RepID=A0A9W7EM66_9STRA|nr:hypothetical protein TL16_g09184 [Triparma laevis f. inornata]